jgi:hypothetical protein
MTSLRHDRVGEHELLDAFASGAARSKGTQARGNCPSLNELRFLAKGGYRKLPAQSAQLLEHLADCDHCNEQMRRIREQTAQKRKTYIRATKAMVALAAIVLLVVGLGIWWQQRPVTGDPNRIAVVDLRPLSPSRGDHPSLGIEAIRVSRLAGRIRVVLPVGGEGDYKVEILAPGGATADPLVRTSASAHIEDHLAILNLPLKLSNLKPGSYSLALQHDDSGWEYYEIVLE